MVGHPGSHQCLSLRSKFKHLLTCDLTCLSFTSMFLNATKEMICEPFIEYPQTTWVQIFTNIHSGEASSEQQAASAATGTQNSSEQRLVFSPAFTTALHRLMLTTKFMQLTSVTAPEVRKQQPEQRRALELLRSHKPDPSPWLQLPADAFRCARVSARWDALAAAAHGWRNYVRRAEKPEVRAEEHVVHQTCVVLPI